MTTLKQTVEETDTLAGRIFNVVIQVTIIISLVTFSLDTLPNLSDEHQTLLRVIETITVLVFTVEYLLRIYVASNKLHFIFSFLGIIDLMAILPFYLAAGLDLRSIRAVRLFRIIRILKLARYNSATQRFRRAFYIAKEEIILFFALTAILLYLAAVGIYYFENTAQPEAFSSVFDSLWWAVATLTTVGYGDIYPVTVGGKCFTFLVLVVGLGVVSVPAGLVASALSRAREMED